MSPFSKSYSAGTVEMKGNDLFCSSPFSKNQNMARNSERSSGSATKVSSLYSPRLGKPMVKSKLVEVGRESLVLNATAYIGIHQIHPETRKFSYQTGLKALVAYGSTPINQKFCELERGVEILVATPRKFRDLLERGRLSLSMIQYLALDEVDRMLKMGFEPQIRKIVQGTDMPLAGKRQTMFFSATFPKEIQRLAMDFLSNYIFLEVERVGSSIDLIVQRVEFVPDADRRSHLMDLIHA